MQDPPGVGLTVPTRHALQPVPPPGEEVPAGQGVQAAAPIMESEPCPQGLHVCTPEDAVASLAAAEPVVQIAHVAEPGPLPEPSGHLKQSPGPM